MTPKIMAFELYVAHNHPTQLPPPLKMRFAACKTPSHADHNRHTDSRLLFQKWSKSVHDKCPKGRAVFLPLPGKKHFYAV